MDVVNHYITYAIYINILKIGISKQNSIILLGLLYILIKLESIVLSIVITDAIDIMGGQSFIRTLI